MKEYLKEMLNSFFISVTFINLAMLVLGLILQPDRQFGYEIFIYPLIYGLIGIIPGLIVRTDKELSIPQFVIRKVFQLTLIVVLMVAFIFGGSPINERTIAAAIGVSVSVIIIYVLVNVIGWFMDLKTAKNLMNDLKEYQSQIGETVEKELMSKVPHGH